MSGERLGRIGLASLRGRLSPRDEEIIRYVARLRLLRAHQVQALLFPDEQHATSATAARCCRRALERLTRERLLVRLERRVGGVRAGSASYVYALGPVGQRLIASEGSRRRLDEPSARFVEHTLAIADLLVAIVVRARTGDWDLMDWQSEPACWREVVTLGGRVLLRPDLLVVLGVNGYELRWFLEVDRANEHTPAIERKCRLYNSYYRAGREQQRHDVFPRVLWIAPSERRARQIEQVIASDRRLTPLLFRTTTTDQALDTLAEVAP